MVSRSKKQRFFLVKSPLVFLLLSLCQPTLGSVRKGGVQFHCGPMELKPSEVPRQGPMLQGPTPSKYLLGKVQCGYYLELTPSKYLQGSNAFVKTAETFLNRRNGSSKPAARHLPALPKNLAHYLQYQFQPRPHPSFVHVSTCGCR